MARRTTRNASRSSRAAARTTRAGTSRPHGRYPTAGPGATGTDGGMAASSCSPIHPACNSSAPAWPTDERLGAARPTSRPHGGGWPLGGVEEEARGPGLLCGGRFSTLGGVAGGAAVARARARGRLGVDRAAAHRVLRRDGLPGALRRLRRARGGQLAHAPRRPGDPRARPAAPRLARDPEPRAELDRPAVARAALLLRALQARRLRPGAAHERPPLPDAARALLRRGPPARR